MTQWLVLTANISTLQAPRSTTCSGDPVDHGIVFVLVEVTLLWFIFRYRHREGRRRIHPRQPAGEIVWTTIPALLVILGGTQHEPRIWLGSSEPVRFPRPPDVDVTAKQFEWNVTYPWARRAARQRMTTSRAATDSTFRWAAHPGAPVLQAEDVIHSFFLPELRVKQDAVPGMRIRCGSRRRRPASTCSGAPSCAATGHYRMKGR
jgi:cytochrome c oxidase subunit II